MLTFENSLSFSYGREPDAVLRNFWDPENGFVWSKGKWCEVVFQFDVPSKAYAGALEAILDIDVFKVEQQLQGQNIFVFLNGLRVGTWFCERRTTFVAAFDARALKKNDNTIVIDTPDAVCPGHYGMSDTRVLGLQLFSLQIRKSG